MIFLSLGLSYIAESLPSLGCPSLSQAFVGSVSPPPTTEVLQVLKAKIVKSSTWGRSGADHNILSAILRSEGLIMGALILSIF